MDQLREAHNNVKVEGILHENRLDIKTHADGRRYIAGDLLVQVSEDNIVAVNFFSFDKKKDGNPNKIFQSLNTVKDSYKSIAKHGIEEADRVSITGGRVESNEFYGQNGQLISTFRVRSNFVNRVSRELEPTAEFQMEGYIQGMTEEILNNDEVTGRFVLNLIVPMYGGRISLLNMFLENPAGINYVQENYEVGDTVKVAGIIRNRVQVVTKAEEMEFGGDIVETRERVYRELIVERGSASYDTDEAFDPALIKQALVQREVDLKALKDKATQASVGKGGFGGKEKGKVDTPF